ncbi:MAG: endolytic transglycosylase MltG [Alphaproteobacteria bacterium]|nr:endolytic transglycosylase MltG [Alphaproteobacteria bacterium]
MKKIIFLLFLIILIALLIITMGIAYWYQHPQKNQQTVVLIERGASLSQITNNLGAFHVLDFPILLKGILYGSGGWHQLKAGEYLIPASVTPAQLIHILKSGDVILHPVTVVEGETSYHLTQKLLKDDHFQGPCEPPTEGSLLPETYHFPRGTERQKIVIRMQNAMHAALSEIWAKRSIEQRLQSPKELVILASIVEKETSLPQERPLVAAVFLNRLKQGIPLQADPTVLYGLTQGKQDLGRALTKEDLQGESPYNTYRQLGLPPSPIANPSLASLKAVANPATADYIYFVANGTGGHVFAVTLEEHQKNHAAWRKIKVRELNAP